MDKIAFKKFCHDEFTKRGFKKHKSTYYLIRSPGLLCELSLQGSYGAAYYINCDLFLGHYSSPKEYPSHYDSDLHLRAICVLSKDTYKGEHFMTPLIEYEKYTADELLPYFAKAFDEIIMPPLVNGKRELLKNIELWHFPPPFVKTKEDVLQKLILILD